jgi:hypothetical protein
MAGLLQSDTLQPGKGCMSLQQLSLHKEEKFNALMHLKVLIIKPKILWKIWSPLVEA